MIIGFFYGHEGVEVGALPNHDLLAGVEVEAEAPVSADGEGTGGVGAIHNGGDAIVAILAIVAVPVRRYRTAGPSPAQLVSLLKGGTSGVSEL
jgi:hypothetical protein